MPQDLLDYEQRSLVQDHVVPTVWRMECGEMALVIGTDVPFDHVLHAASVQQPASATLSSG